MFDTIRRSFQILKLCLHVLSVDKELIFFPIFSSIAFVFVALTFAGITFGIGSFDRVAAGALNIVDLIAVFAFYVASYFVIIFFNSALVFAAHERLEGGDPNIRSGMAGASNRIITIFLWSIIAATVGLILAILSGQARERGGIMGIIGHIVVSILGAAWTLITFFVVPLIVIEHRGLADSFKTSLSMLKRTWGDQIVGNFGLGIASFLAYLVVAGITALLVFLLSMLGDVGTAMGIGIGVLLFAAVALIFATLSGIYKAALYNFAATGQVPMLFSDDTIRGAFRQR